MERKQRRLEENKISILKAAERVFAQKGYSLTSMDDIASESQFSKATLYRYYKSKREIFIEIISNTFEEVHQKMTKILLKDLSAEEKLKELIHNIISYYHKKKNISRIFYMERAAMVRIFNIDTKEHISHFPRHPQIPHEFKTKMGDVVNTIGEIIKEGIESGEFRNVDVKDAAFVFGAMLRGFHFKGPIHDKEYSVDKSTDLLHSYFLYGIKKDRQV